MKTNFRIVCLKNDDNRMLKEDKVKNSNILVPIIEKKDKKTQDSLVPNIVHLSARLQDDSRQSKRPQSQSYQQYVYEQGQQNTLSNDDFSDISHNKAQQIKRLRQLEIQRFFEEKRTAIQKQKNTMKNLLGSINFSLNKNREKKISRMIKDACGSEKNDKKFKSSQKAVAAQNKLQLQSDFQCFLSNKNKKNSFPIQDIEQFKLKRLCKVNPEQEFIQSARGAQVKPLNLFHFLKKEQLEESPKFKHNPRNRSTSNVKAQASFKKGKIGKKLFNLQSNLKTQQEQFGWSKLKDSSPNNKNFTFRTLDL